MLNPLSRDQNAIRMVAGAPVDDDIQVAAGLYWVDWYLFFCQPGLKDWEPGGKEARAYVLLMMDRLSAVMQGGEWNGEGL